MQVFQTKDLEARGVLTPNSSTLKVRGCPFRRGPAFAKARRKVALKYCQLLDQRQVKNFMVEEELCLTIWQPIHDEAPQSKPSALTEPSASTESPASPAAAASSPLPHPFVIECEQELALCVGPIAKQLIKTTIAQLPEATPTTLITALANKISDPLVAQTFYHKLELSLARQHDTLSSRETPSKTPGAVGLSTHS